MRIQSLHALPLLLALAFPATASAASPPPGLDPARVRTIRLTSLALGATAGLGVGTFTVRAPGLLYESGAPGPWAPVAIPTVLVQTASLAGATCLFSEWFMRHPLPWYLLVPAGVVGGVLVGATSGALTWGTMASLGYAFDSMDFGSLEDDFWVRAGMGTAAGGFWGGLSGVIPGAVAAPLVVWGAQF